MWTPSVEVFERDNNLVVRAELPGLDKDDVKVELTDDGLIIEGDRRREHEERFEGGYRSEIAYGHFHRLIPLPEGANIDQAKAQMNNGVLEVAIPMAEARRPRRSIPVETGPGKATQTTGEQAQTAAGGSEGDDLLTGFRAWAHPDWSPWLTWAVAVAGSLLLFASVLLHELAIATTERRGHREMNMSSVSSALCGGQQSSYIGGGGYL